MHPPAMNIYAPFKHLMFWSQLPAYVPCTQADTKSVHRQVYYQKISIHPTD